MVVVEEVVVGFVVVLVVLVLLVVVVLVVVTGTEVVEVVDIAGGAVPKLGVAAQVATCRPCTSDARPSGCRGSLNPAGRVPTIPTQKSSQFNTHTL